MLSLFVTWNAPEDEDLTVTSERSPTELRVDRSVGPRVEYAVRELDSLKESVFMGTLFVEALVEPS